MGYSVVHSEVMRQRVETALKMARKHGLLAELKRNLLTLHERMAQSPVEAGELRYTMKYVNLAVFDMAFENIAVRYAVDQDESNVFVMNYRLYGRHPFPDEIDAILNPK